MAKWPPENTQPTEQMPFYHDGTYSDDWLKVSPEGNIWGQRRRVQSWPHKYWWDGSGWVKLDPEGLVTSVNDLPAGTRPFGEIWGVRIEHPVTGKVDYTWYYWDSENSKFEPIDWWWNVSHYSALPQVGFKVGEGHTVDEKGVPVYWNGYEWVREKHSALEDDEPERHLPPGFLRLLPADVRVVYVSTTELGMEPVEGGSGKIWVNGEYLQANKTMIVLRDLPVLNWNSQTNTVESTYIEPSTEYWVYLANNQSTAYKVNALEGDDDHNATPDWDFRGKLFLSTSSDVDGYLSNTGAGEHARLVGKVETDSTAVDAGGPYFLRELNISIISRTTSFPETYRDYSDYRITYIDNETLQMSLLDGMYGQIYVGGNLYYLGSNYQITTDGGYIEWDAGATDKISYTLGNLDANTLYYIYIGASVDALNKNTTNPSTNRPWQEQDDGSSGNYDADLDFRLRPFLCTETPDHGRLSEQYPGYWTRHIGQVTTDQDGNFINARDLSEIRQAPLNPSYFDGLAEIVISPVDEYEFKITQRKGTSGVVNVRGEAIQTYEDSDARCHTVTNSGSVFYYTEANYSSPLAASGVISDHHNSSLYIYLANSRDFWGEQASDVFVSPEQPVNGYLSRNWTGNNARWLATLVPDQNGKFTGSYLPETAGTIPITMDDTSTSQNEVWSSSKIDGQIRIAMLMAQNGFDLPCRLTRNDTTSIKLDPIGNQPRDIILPDYSILTIPASGIQTTVSGLTTYTYYCYLDSAGLSISRTEPDRQYPKQHTLGADKLLVGWLCFSSAGSMDGDQCVWSFANEQTEFTESITSATTTISVPGYLVPPGKTATLYRTGQSSASAWKTTWVNNEQFSTHITCINGSSSAYATSNASGNINQTGSANLSHETVTSGIYSSFSLTHTLNTGSWRSFSGDLILKRNP